MAVVSREVRRERRYLVGAVKSALAEQEARQKTYSLEVGRLGVVRVLSGIVPPGHVHDLSPASISITERRTIPCDFRIAHLAIGGYYQPCLQVVLDPVEANYFTEGMAERPPTTDANWRKWVMAARFSAEDSQVAAQVFLRDLPRLVTAEEYKVYNEHQSIQNVAHGNRK